MTKTITSREFNHDTSGAKRATQNGPVFITERGRPAHVLLTMDDYTRLSGRLPSLADTLGIKDGDDIEFDPPKLNFISKPADFD